MPKLIKQSVVIENIWKKLDTDFDENISNQAVLVPLDRFIENPDLVIGNAQAGVWLDSDQGPGALEPFIEKLALIAINFPKFVDGRGYSYARILRDRFNYQGELRAIGDVLHDQLFYLKRCGFDSFAIREDKDVDSAKSGLSAFTETYQGATDQPQPLFRRR
tara:strand:+ start:26374 stop:26859 length:486 start_codon:yes stop_codon:yes gene_type:complete